MADDSEANLDRRGSVRNGLAGLLVGDTEAGRRAKGPPRIPRQSIA
jgi:hypothetical protein